MIQNISCKRILVVACTLLLLASLVVNPVAATNATTDTENKNFVVMYVVGSNLVEDAHKNLVNLSKSMNETAGDAIIIYGASKKTGWGNNASITNLSLLKKDAEDGVIGIDKSTNESTQYIIKRFLDADMSTPEVLGETLAFADAYAKNNSLESANRYLIFWDHGAAWKGYGKNPLTDKMLSLNDIDKGLSCAEKYDIIIFDACLMASIEVADALQTHADYLLADEEIVINTGAIEYFEVFSDLSKNPEMTPIDFAKLIVDTNIKKDVVLHYPKMLVLTDLSQVNDVKDALYKFGNTLNKTLDNPETMDVLGAVYASVQTFGIYRVGVEVNEFSTSDSEDIYSLAEMIEIMSRDDTEVHKAAIELKEKINDYVIYIKSNGAFKGANGVSVASLPNYYEYKVHELVKSICGPQNISIPMSKYQDRLPVNNPWASYTLNYVDMLISKDNNWINSKTMSITTLTADDDTLEKLTKILSNISKTQNGTVQNGTVQNGTVQNETVQNETIYNGTKAPLNVIVHNPEGDNKVYIHYLYEKDGQYICLEKNPLEINFKESDNPIWKLVPTGKYYLPEWDGTSFAIADKSNKDGVLVYLNYLNNGDTAQSLYTISGDFTTVVDGKTVEYKNKTIFVSISNDDKIVNDVTVYINKSTILAAKAGDTFRPYQYYYNETTDEIDLENYTVSNETITFGDDPKENFIRVQLNPDDCYYYVESESIIDLDDYNEALENANAKANAKSPLSTVGIVVGLSGAVGLVLMRRRS